MQPINKRLVREIGVILALKLAAIIALKQLYFTAPTQGEAPNWLAPAVCQTLQPCPATQHTSGIHHD